MSYVLGKLKMKQRLSLKDSVLRRGTLQGHKVLQLLHDGHQVAKAPQNKGVGASIYNGVQSQHAFVACVNAGFDSDIHAEIL